jgi:hypothetical protein
MPALRPRSAEYHPRSTGFLRMTRPSTGASRSDSEPCRLKTLRLILFLAHSLTAHLLAAHLLPDERIVSRALSVSSTVLASKRPNNPHWCDLILFYEYFHGDNGAGIGANHQTGWTGLVAPLLDLLSGPAVNRPPSFSIA